MAGRYRFGLTFVLVLGLLSGGVGAETITEPGTYSAGVIYLPYSTEVSPLDALAIYTRPAREIASGETGRLIQVRSQVYHLREGQRSGGVSLELSTQAGMAEAVLQPGTYEVVTTTTRHYWQWLPFGYYTHWFTGEERYSGLAKMTQHFSEQTDSYSIEILAERAEPHPCEGTNIREGIQTEEAEILREAVAQAFAAQGAQIGPEHVVVFSPERPQTEAGWDTLTFTVPLQMTDNQPRPNMVCLVEAMQAGEIEPGSLIGAGEIVFGNIQQVGGRTRVVIKRVETETTLVPDAGMATAEGVDQDALQQAIEEAAGEALDGIDFR